MTPFQAVSTALASTVGMGSIAGVAAALAVGGPGSIFWMWLLALLGTITKTAEITLGRTLSGRRGEWPIPWRSHVLHPQGSGLAASSRRSLAEASLSTPF